MTILGVEFSSPQRSVALSRNGVIAEASEMGGRNTAALGMIEKVLGETGAARGEIGTLAVGLGPGSYTGIRAAIALAQGWQLANGVKLLGVSSVEAMVEQAAFDDDIFGEWVSVVIDAQRNEFYVAAYCVEPDGWTELEPLHIVPLADIQARAAKHLIVGPEVTKWVPGGRIIFPRAATLARLAEKRDDFVAGEKLVPIYLRETAFVKAPPSRVIKPPFQPTVGDDARSL